MAVFAGRNNHPDILPPDASVNPPPGQKHAPAPGWRRCGCGPPLGCRPPRAGWPHRSGHLQDTVAVLQSHCNRTVMQPVRHACAGGEVDNASVPKPHWSAHRQPPAHLPAWESRPAVKCGIVCDDHMLVDPASSWPTLLGHAARQPQGAGAHLCRRPDQQRKRASRQRPHVLPRQRKQPACRQLLARLLCSLSIV